MALKPIIRRVTLEGEDFSFSFKEDETEYAMDLMAVKSNGLNEDNIYDYFAPGEFSDDEINDLNGKHFIYGFLEALYQSSRCPDTLYSYSGKLNVKVEIIEPNP